jgi:hypothetical protein
MKISYTKCLVAPVMLSALASTVLPAHAQRERPSREERRGQRQERRQQMTPEQRQQAIQQRLQNMTPEQRQRMQQRFQERMQQMTPEQRQQAQQALQNGDFAALQGMMGGRGGQGGRGGFGGGNAAAREERQRQLMVQSGITDKTVQDTIIEFVRTQEQARRPLLQMARDLSQNLATRPNEEITTVLAAFRKAAADDQTRYEAALKELDQKIQYSANPKIETFLTLIGVIGNEVLPIGGPAAVFPPPAGGQGGRGGRGGRGGQGGRGGRGGANGAPAAAPAA